MNLGRIAGLILLLAIVAVTWEARAVLVAFIPTLIKIYVIYFAATFVIAAAIIGIGVWVLPRLRA